MRKSKSILYVGIGVVLFIAILALSGYRLSVGSIIQEMDQKAHFTPSEVIYTVEKGDEVIVVTKHEDWLQSHIIHRTFGFLYKESKSLEPINIEEYPDLSIEELRTGLADRVQWPETMLNITSATKATEENEIELLPQHWWIITSLMDPGKWKSTTASEGSRILAVVMKDTAGKTYSFYLGGKILIVVEDTQHQTEIGRYLMDASAFVSVDGAFSNSIANMKLIKQNKALIDKMKLTSFMQVANVTYDPLWNVDLFSLEATQSDQIRSLLSLEQWQLTTEPVIDFEAGYCTLFDVNGTRYRMVSSSSMTYIEITDPKHPYDQYIRVMRNLSDDLSTYIRSLKPVVPPSEALLSVNFNQTTVGAYRKVSTHLLEEFPGSGYSYTFGLTPQQNETLKSLLDLSSWDKYDQPFTRGEYGDPFYTFGFMIKGTKGETLMFSEPAAGNTKVKVTFKDKTEYYTMDSADSVAAQAYLASLYVPQGVNAAIPKVTIMSDVTYLLDLNIVSVSLTAEQITQLKTILQFSTWTEAINLNDQVQTNTIMDLYTKEHFCIYILKYEDRVLISVIDGSGDYFYEGERWIYFAPSSLENEIREFMKSLN